MPRTDSSVGIEAQWQAPKWETVLSDRHRKDRVREPDVAVRPGDEEVNSVSVRCDGPFDSYGRGARRRRELRRCGTRKGACRDQKHK